jgi:hypothetical protein
MAEKIDPLAPPKDLVAEARKLNVRSTPSILHLIKAVPELPDVVVVIENEQPFVPGLNTFVPAATGVPDPVKTMI